MGPGSRLRSAGTTPLLNPWQRRKTSEAADDFSGLVFDPPSAIELLEDLPGVLVSECRGALVIALGGCGVPRAAAPVLRERSHPFQRAGMVLRRRLLEQRARCG